eukprot:6950713-Heterocapsa_arctica.AAC.1
MVAKSYDGGLRDWFKTAVETGRFFKGVENTACFSAMTFARIKKFVDPDVQTEGQRWMAMELLQPLLTAVADYDAWLIDTGNKF